MGDDDKKYTTSGCAYCKVLFLSKNDEVEHYLSLEHLDKITEWIDYVDFDTLTSTLKTNNEQ